MWEKPWVSFCISTFKRPVFLRDQLSLLLKQSFQVFEIVISDNDPEASGEKVALEFHDSRIKYFHNGENLGMIRSFNKSIERAMADYIVMVTDDDPVDQHLLADMHALHQQYPGFSIYGGFMRSIMSDLPEIIRAENFIAEILDPKKTPWMLWSSCIMERLIVLQNNGIPDYGSPHLADHALIAMVGSKGGAVLVQKKYSFLSSHDSNFSKFNFNYYVQGCKGFYETLEHFCNQQGNFGSNKTPILKHLGSWFMANFFNLKRYYTVTKHDPSMLEQVDNFGRTIIAFPFMRQFAVRYHCKRVIFNIKKYLGLLKR